MTTRQFMLGCLLAPIALFSHSAHAQYVEYQIKGTVSSMYDTPNSTFKPIFDQLGFEPAFGDAMTATYRVNTNTSGTVFGPGQVEYLGALNSVSVTVTHGQRTGRIVIASPQHADDYVAMFNNVDLGGIYETAYFAELGSASNPDAGNTGVFVFYAALETQAPLSPPLYPNPSTAICQAPPAADLPNLSASLGITLEHWEGGIAVAQNYLYATYVSATITPASC